MYNIYIYICVMCVHEFICICTYIRRKEHRSSLYRMVYLFMLNEELHFREVCIVGNRIFEYCVLRVRGR